LAALTVKKTRRSATGGSDARDKYGRPCAAAPCSARRAHYLDKGMGIADSFIRHIPLAHSARSQSFGQRGAALAAIARPPRKERAIQYIGGRLVQAFFTLTLFMALLFVATRAAGDPAALNLPADATPEQIQLFRERIGTDKSYLDQFGVFVRDMATFRFGRSIVYNQPVVELIGSRLIATLKLQFVSLLLILVSAFPLGILAATRRGRFADYAVRIVAAFGQSAPSFWVGLMLMAFVSVKLGWLPAGGIGSGGFDSVKHYILPAITTSLLLFAALVRLLRSSMLETLDSEFVKLARAKGVSEAKIVWVHVLRNAILPVITFMGIWLATAISGSVVIEVVFDWPGLGAMFVESIASRDFPIIQTIVGLVAVSVIVVNLLVDMLYAIVDPRIRLGKTAKS
jgi:peptide/nickel transport system permease protein